MGYLGSFASGEFPCHLSLEPQPEVACAQEKVCRSIMPTYPETHPTCKSRAPRDSFKGQARVFLKTRDKEKLRISVSGKDLCLPHTQGPVVFRQNATRRQHAWQHVASAKT